MSKPVVALIGAIGAGKSAAAGAFARRGGLLLDADKIGHTVLESPDIKERLADRWGADLTTLTGKELRRKIAAIVFADGRERKALEAIVYPRLEAQCRNRIAEAQTDPEVRFIVLDAAVLLEAGWAGIAQRIVFVETSLEIRRQRVAARGWSAEDLAAREAAQWPVERKKALADAVIENNGTLDELQTSVDRLLAQWGWI